MQASYDVIVIGSGIGGLTVASLLTQIAKKRVLVLESHFKLGGLTHSFQRHGYHWDVGLHYIGGMAPGSMTRGMMDLVTGGQVQWCKIDDPLEHFIYPGLHFQVPSSQPAYKAQLKQAFPDNSSQIDCYFRLVDRAASWMGRWFASKQMPRLLGSLIQWPGRALPLKTTQQVLEQTISNPQLRSLLASQWGDYGLPPALSAFGTHAIVVKDYFSGAYVPKGGAAQLAKAIEPIIQQGGGRCVTGHRVVNFRVAKRRVLSVIVEHKREQLEFTAPLVVSAAGAQQTFTKFIPAEVEIPERLKLPLSTPPPTALNVYLGLRSDPRAIGMDAGNYWIATDYDHDALHRRRGQLDAPHIEHCFLSAASLREPEATKHTAQIICFSDYQAWARWADQPWLNRDAAYQELKANLASRALALVEQQLPGFSALVDYTEVSTPLSVESMTGHAGGAIYGLPGTPERLSKGLYHAQSSLKNLLLAGCDVGSVGIVGAMMGGVMSTAWALGPTGFLKLLRAARAYRSVD